MAGIRKIMLTPYFGDFPAWMDKYEPPAGYDWILDTDLKKFKQRVGDILGIEYPGVYGSGKVWDYRPCLGLLYSDEITSYDFWGHTDFDCVYGDVNKWVTDEFLSGLDVHSNHWEYVNGCWSLYRNNRVVKTLFAAYWEWLEKLKYPDANGWVENEYSRILERSGLKYKYTFFQGDPYTVHPELIKRDGKLYQNINGVCVEVMMFHFRRSKRWPL